MHTITQRLKTQHPSLLREVVQDLQVLKGEQLRERIAQRQAYIADTLGEWGSHEDTEMENLLCSPRAQLRFLKEHLKHHEIIAVLLSYDATAGINYVKKIPQLTSNVPSQWYLDMLIAYKSILEQEQDKNSICQTLLSAISWLTEELGYQIAEEIDNRQNCIPLYCHTPQKLQEIQSWIARWCQLYAETIIQINHTNKYIQAAKMYIQAHNALTISWCDTNMQDIELLMCAAKSYRQGGNLQEAEDLYLFVNNLVESLTEKLQEINHNISADRLSINRTLHKQKLLNNDAAKHLHVSYLFYLLILLEKIQLHVVEHEPALLREIQKELDLIYEYLKIKNMITANKKSPYEAANIWRFTYAWYMCLVNEPEYAYKELDLLHPTATPQEILEAADKLRQWNKVTFITTKQGRIIPLNRNTNT